MEKESEQQTKWINKWGEYIFTLLYVAGLEVAFHLTIFKHFDGYMVHAILFSLPFSFFVLLLGSTKNHMFNRIIRILLLLLITIYFTAQIIYYQVFGNFLSLKSILNGADQAMDFGSTIGEAFLENGVLLVVVWLVFIAYSVLTILSQRKGQGEKVQFNWKYRLICGLVILLLPFLMTLVLMAEGVNMNSAYRTKVQFHRTEQSMYKLGFCETLFKDITQKAATRMHLSEKRVNGVYLWIENQFFKENVENASDSETKEATEAIADTKKEEQKEVLYHEWDIPFDILNEQEEDSDLLDMNEYFSKLTPSSYNEFTGMFEGYNLIYITAESFSDVIIDKERTPILYQMREEGFQFDNFYTPSWYLSTIDGEYVNCLGQIPVEGDWSLEHASKNTIPFALGNQLKDKGYTCNAYHNHDSYYYDRTITHPALGYSFKAVGAGLTFESMYPESDLELMEITVDEYIDKQPFHTYYMTMSGHLPYTYDYNSMAVKNREIIEGLDLTENAQCYLAANEELEYSLEFLVEELEKAGELEHTLFVIAPDHYPYGLKKGAYDELRGKKVEEDDFEIYRNGCLIWSAGMKDMEEFDFPVKIEKVGSNLDLVPTISNLMGLSYDSRLFAGRDLLSEEEGLVMFKDQSFMTDRVRYNATSGETIWAAGEAEDEAYLEQIMQEVQNRFYYSAQVLSKDYFKVILDALEQ